MRRWIHCDGMRVRADVFTIEHGELAMRDVEHGEISTLGGDVEITEPGIDAQDVRTAARRREGRRVRSFEVDSDDAIVVLTSNERTGPVRVQPHAVGTLATRKPDAREHITRLRV